MVANSVPKLRPVLGALAVALAAAGTWVACGGESERASEAPARAEPSFEDPRYADYPPTAVLSTVEELRTDLELERHPSDGGGRAWLAAGPKEVRISERADWTVVYEAGPLGVAEGGMITFMTSPFWGWDDHPQAIEPKAPGFTRVWTEADGVELRTRELPGNALGIEVTGRALAEGETVHVHYGAGDFGARADKYRERSASFWIAVDGDGDGVRQWIAENARLDVLAGPPSGLWVTLPTSASVGETVTATLALLDARGNAWIDWEGAVLFPEWPEGLEGPERVELPREAAGMAKVEVTVRASGLYRLSPRLDPPLPGAPEDFAYESNPMLASESALPVLWADLHGHSQLSDGTGTPEDYYVYARDVAALDVASLTDHDHWGIHYLDQRPDLWEHIQEVTNSFYEPGRFVSLVGYEWTSWIYGHRHVVYFTDSGEVHSSIDPDYESPAQLWSALDGLDALTFAHHSAGGPVATDWSFEPDPLIEPVTEIVSVHGSSEAPDSPNRIYRSVPGNFVRDVLDRGMRFGFIGSGDSHDGHPGLAHLASPSGGLAAILAEERTRESVLEALRARRVYATNGSRILLRTSLGGHRMGATVAADEERPLTLRVHVVGTGPLESLELIRSGEVLRLDCEGEREVSLPPLDIEFESGEYLYVRVEQSDGGVAWSSPFYAD